MTQAPAKIARKLDFEDRRALATLLGTQEDTKTVADALRRGLDVELHVRGTDVTLEGLPDSLDDAEVALRKVLSVVQSAGSFPAADVARALQILRKDPSAELTTVFDDTIIARVGGGRAIGPRSWAQKRYVEALRRRALVFGVGPAGTGKTYLAVAMAMRRLLDRQVRRIVLTRPAIEAGENLGFLPGTFEEKVSPYMRPLYDALFDIIEPPKLQKLVEQGAIEVAPLAYMRGRTLHDSFVILDEAQNTTRDQMKMLLTRIGAGSWCVVAGDPTQVDLPGGQRSGLGHALSVLRDVEGIAICRFTEVDVMRHPLVQAIVMAYDRDDKRRAALARRREAEEAGALLDEGPVHTDGAEARAERREPSGARAAAPEDPPGAT